MRRSIVKGFLIYVLALGVSIAFAFPIIWIVLTAFKTKVDVFAIPPKFLFNPTLENLRRVMEPEFAKCFQNSIVIAVLSASFSIVLGTATAYGFSRYGGFKGSDNVLFWILSLRMLPPIAVVVPYYIILNWITPLKDSRIALIAIYSIFNISFCVWLLKGFFDEVPPELEEAAMLSGYSPAQVLFRVSLPLVRPGLVAASIFCLIQTLNEFLLALMLTQVRAVTVPVYLSRLQKQFGMEWGQFAAAATIFVIPVAIFTIIVRKQLIRGLSFGRMK